MTMYSSFFFQAEDGIRDADVTGVQTCALPISELTFFRRRERSSREVHPLLHLLAQRFAGEERCAQVVRGRLVRGCVIHRSEERRAGKECSLWCGPWH